MNLLGDLLEGLVTLETNSDSYLVGERPAYRITGAIPGSIIAWTSFQNGTETGEYQANYGQVIGADGTFQAEGGAWTEANVGLWQKQAVIIPPDGDISKIQTAQVVFPVESSNQPAATSGQGGFFDSSVDIAGFGTRGFDSTPSPA